MTPLRFGEARECVLRTVRPFSGALSEETVSLADASGRVLARPVMADRDYPPIARSVRDGFAVRAADLPGPLRLVGEVQAGRAYEGVLGAGECIEIMTGAPVPSGADAVVMVEHVERDNSLVTPKQAVKPGDFINPQGAEARAGDIVLSPGRFIDYAGIGVLATVGAAEVSVFRRPRVSILATGDELVALEQKPLPYQIRNSNSYSLAAQVIRAGGLPEVLPVAPDEYGHTRQAIERALSKDLLLLSGGVSAGKYDMVEQVLGDLGAEFFFDRVLIQPGQPLVFGRARDCFFLGLPGNPVSTMVTFELFARAAIELLSGVQKPSLIFTAAKLRGEFRHKSGLTRFLPACLSPDGKEVRPVQWRGSSDIIAVAQANAYLVVPDDRESWSDGDSIEVLPR